MAGRTFAIGDIHGEREHLARIWSLLPLLDAGDTVVFLGDYVNRGPHSKQVVEMLMALPALTAARVVCLRGNHEDAWLRVRAEGWDEFALKAEHGCLATLRSYVGGAFPTVGEKATNVEMAQLAAGDFLPARVIEWMAALPFWYEDDRGIYVHAGLPSGDEGFIHPRNVGRPAVLAWVRTDHFVRNYHGTKVVFGHTPVTLLPADLSVFTPEDPSDAWVNESVVGLDTGCGLGGFLSAIELPSMRVSESRVAPVLRTNP
jgi:serine/threonine protein phosphatase 1